MKFKVKKPIPGFENINEVELVEIDNSFAVLKDEKGNTLFTLINPYVLVKDYSFEIPSDVKALLELDKSEGVLVYNNVVMKEPITESIVNFKGPFIFNPKNNTCAQLITDEFGYEKIGDFLNTNAS